MKTHQSTPPTSPNITVRPLREAELPEADRLFHLAFGTFVGLPDPMQFAAGRDFVRSRWHADPSAAFAAEADGQLIGTNQVTRWGSVGFFGPLTVHPNFWNRGIASRLLEPAMRLFEQWGTTHAGLFTFPHSAKHLHLYQKFGFWPRFLTAIMSRPLQPGGSASSPTTYSALSADRQAETLTAARELTNAVYEGLDVGWEVLAVSRQRVGDTVLLWEDSGLVGFAVCHCGAGTEAGEGTCYIKFGAVRPGPHADQTFDRLIDACESFAIHKSLSRIEAGVNLARDQAYRRMQARGFRTAVLGVAMHKPNNPAYNHPDTFLIDDWR